MGADETDGGVGVEWRDKYEELEIMYQVYHHTNLVLFTLTTNTLLQI